MEKTTFEFLSPSPTGFFKLNFDRSSKGNIAPMGFGYIIISNQEEMQGFRIGFIGTDSNNVTEVEVLIHGINPNQYNWTPLITEGDSWVFVRMETQIQHGNYSSNVVALWRLEGRLELASNNYKLRIS